MARIRPIKLPFAHEVLRGLLVLAAPHKYTTASVQSFVRNIHKNFGQTLESYSRREYEQYLYE